MKVSTHRSVMCFLPILTRLRDVEHWKFCVAAGVAKLAVAAINELAKVRRMMYERFDFNGTLIAQFSVTGLSA